jgi:hypothetical protein
MPGISRYIGRGIFFGLVLLALGASIISVVTPRQALILSDFFEAQSSGIEVGSIVFVGNDGSYDIVRPNDICKSVSNFQTKESVERFPNQRFQVSTDFSLRFLPWDSQATFTVEDSKTVQPGKLFADLFSQSDQCEVEFGERSKNKCVLVVSELARTDNGVDVMRLSGCQLIDPEDYYLIASELGPGQHYKDLFAGVSKLERFWISIKEKFVRISTTKAP